MSKWEDREIEEKIRGILGSVEYDHHFGGRPFISAYQLAIAFAEEHKDESREIRLEVGGLGTGSRASLAQYLARELSRRIKTKEISEIEGAFLGNCHLKRVSFELERGNKEVV